ncbi:ABC transporter permease [Pseudomonas sp. F8002]|uniref:ABC transporter permease n=1 Tax=Pseudomonas sp. F8002 TaxID=2738822 RepID=UPI0015A2EE1C|nr:ABC transporter permease [Pseudomonas sp. F8002]NWB52649.1 ABC transporter permease [Pseudomonas sp. F8002]
MIQVYRLLFLIFLLVFWECVSRWFGAEFFISRPSAVAQSLWKILMNGVFFYHAGITTLEAVLGFFFGSLAGLIAGLVLGRAKLLADILDPFLTAFYSLPKVALAPLFILWFGIGLPMKVILTAAVVFFLVFLNTYSGVRNVSREQLTILRLMGAKERDLLTMVVIPSAFTWVFTGLRLSVPYALIGALVGEIIAANRGLGYLLSDAASQFDTAGVFAALVGIIVLALILNTAVKLAERKLMPWKANEAEREVAV